MVGYPEKKLKMLDFEQSPEKYFDTVGCCDDPAVGEKRSSALVLELSPLVLSQGNLSKQ